MPAVLSSTAGEARERASEAWGLLLLSSAAKRCSVSLIITMSSSRAFGETAPAVRSTESPEPQQGHARVPRIPWDPRNSILAYIFQIPYRIACCMAFQNLSFTPFGFRFCPVELFFCVWHHQRRRPRARPLSSLSTKLVPIAKHRPDDNGARYPHRAALAHFADCKHHIIPTN